MNQLLNKKTSILQILQRQKQSDIQESLKLQEKIITVASRNNKTNVEYHLPNESLWNVLSCMDRDSILNLSKKLHLSMPETQNILLFTNHRKLNPYNADDRKYVKETFFVFE